MKRYFKLQEVPEEVFRAHTGTSFSCNEIIVNMDDGVYIGIDCDKKNELRVNIENFNRRVDNG